MEWYSGLDNYRKHTIVDNVFTTELLDVPLHNFGSIQECFAAHLNGANLPIEVLYSGGLDSECVIVACLQQNIPVKAVTMRLMFRGAPFNVSDLYYAERFCRKYNVEQVVHDLDIELFIRNGDHISYMEPYNITMFPAATVQWLIEQCETFPVVGGDYSWPQTNIGKKIYSPHRHDYNCHDLFMQDRGITGIGNMISHSLESNCFFIKEHLNVYDSEDGRFKIELMKNLGFGELEYRHRSHGWETATMLKYDWDSVTRDIKKRFNEVKSVIVWGETLANLVDGKPGSNEKY